MLPQPKALIPTITNIAHTCTRLPCRATDRPAPPAARPPARPHHHHEQLLAAAWPRMHDVYVLGSVQLVSSAPLAASCGRLAHLDLFHSDAAHPFTVQLDLLPASLRALGVQNVILEGAARARHLQARRPAISRGGPLYAFTCVCLCAHGPFSVQRLAALPHHICLSSAGRSWGRSAKAPSAVCRLLLVPGARRSCTP